jgi:hypothetical protein
VWSSDCRPEVWFLPGLLGRIKLQTEGEEIVIGIVAVGVAVVVATVLIIHYSKKRKITGCVNSGESGRLSPTKEKRVWVLSGNMVGVKPGD